MIDYSHVEARQDGIHYRLESWAQWVKVRPQTWKAMSIWKMYRPPRQWAYETSDIQVQLNTLECHETERAVSFLPDKNRDALRWYYVYPYISPTAMRRDLGVTRDGLGKLVVDGRDMLVNRLRQGVKEIA